MASLAAIRFISRNAGAIRQATCRLGLRSSTNLVQSLQLHTSINKINGDLSQVKQFIFASLVFGRVNLEACSCGPLSLLHPLRIAQLQMFCLSLLLLYIWHYYVTDNTHEILFKIIL